MESPRRSSRTRRSATTIYDDAAEQELERRKSLEAKRKNSNNDDDDDGDGDGDETWV